MSPEDLKRVIEAALLAAGRPLSPEDIIALFEESGDPPRRGEVQEALAALSADWEGRALELVEV
ncbi:MAG: SMC-Scp complex subunit ScpB, partial [Gammaproteobacteria bacterium]|nr:SMC-Scp complex subunit ScpB [Gammaproteobacteria bacterium]